MSLLKVLLFFELHFSLPQCSARTSRSRQTPLHPAWCTKLLTLWHIRVEHLQFNWTSNAVMVSFHINFLPSKLACWSSRATRLWSAAQLEISCSWDEKASRWKGQLRLEILSAPHKCLRMLVRRVMLNSACNCLGRRSLASEGRRLADRLFFFDKYK